MHCGACIEVCPEKAISASPALPTLNRKACSMCLDCVDVCPPLALKEVGQKMTVNEVLDIVEKDSIFYESSGGGVTFSGGEPTFQFDFLQALLEESGRRGLHRVVETNGHVDSEQFQKMVAQTELVFIDFKHPDTANHKRFTGAGNELVRANMAYLANSEVSWVPRIPLIPGVNDSPDDLRMLGQLIKHFGAAELHLLPYHKLGESKRKEIGLTGKAFADNREPPSREEVQQAAEILEECGVAVVIHGES
jgi:pyruvate formate lyase activating enzyme